MGTGLEKGRLLFHKNVNVMMKAYIAEGLWEEALNVYCRMQGGVISPDSFTLKCVLRACASLRALQAGKKIHAHAVVGGFESDVLLGNALVGMYAECGEVAVARQVFDRMTKRDVVSWNAMIAAYATKGPCHQSLTLYCQMRQAGACVQPDSFTFNFVLKACAALSAAEEGKAIHNHIVGSGLESVVFVGNSLVAMYAKCGSMDAARHCFDRMPKRDRDVVSWNTMIAGYALNGYAHMALNLFLQMQLEGMEPNTVTMASVLPACSQLAAEWIHGFIIKRGFEADVVVGTGVIDLYAKSGRTEVARQVFDKMPMRNVVTWSAMIGGYGLLGQGEDAISLFWRMQRAGVTPDHVTFLCVLCACSHAGLVDEGRRIFDCMRRQHCIPPREEHYACMVDLLGRAGCLDEAHHFIQTLPLKPGVKIWGALLGASSIHCNIELGEAVAERLLALEPQNAGRYVVLSNIYAAAGRWDDVTKVRAMMKERGVKKTPGSSTIELNNRAHAFLVGDASHPQHWRCGLGR